MEAIGICPIVMCCGVFFFVDVVLGCYIELFSLSKYMKSSYQYVFYTS